MNFPMNDFGVRPARLKALAQQPVFPVPKLPAQSVQVATQPSTLTLQGLTLKSVETLGEQSAAGLGSIAGVIVLAVAPGSAGATAGLQARDVIIGTGPDPQAALQTVNHVAALQTLLST